ncbi:response regulator [candidate division KSB1 bacterium]|nr:response regulator [candidate division KSB1 bacterium]MCH8954624.1 response regulator [candidate division KSB1 bacterium]
MTTLLIADDEQSFLDFMVRLLQKDHELLIARNWNEVLEKFESNLWRLNATILDVNMPGLSVDPFTMVDKLLKSNPSVPMIIISGQDIVLKHDFLEMGVFQYHGKPIDMVDLKLTINGALEFNRTLRKLENYQKFDRDQAKFYRRLLKIDLDEIRERISTQDTDKNPAPILIRGEDGTRPYMLAKLINAEIDGKLFFEKVCNDSLKNIIPYNLQNGDTLYLEGIERLGKDEQAYLLKILEDSNEDNLNGRQLPRFRLIASISKPDENKNGNNPEFAKLLEHMEKLEFRIEPLRLRKHDLREIIDLVFEKKKKEIYAKPEAIAEELYEPLLEYNWPLNYDELNIIIESLLLTCPDALIRQKHLHQLDFSDIANSKYPTLDDMVDEHIKKALRLTMGNKSRAARMLGITPKTLYARIRQ